MKLERVDSEKCTEIPFIFFKIKHEIFIVKIMIKSQMIIGFLLFILTAALRLLSEMAQ